MADCPEEHTGILMRKLEKASFLMAFWKENQKIWVLSNFLVLGVVL
jgi:hypothetical protein